MLKVAEGIVGLERKEGLPVEIILEMIGIVSEETEKAGGIVVCGTIGSMVAVVGTRRTQNSQRCDAGKRGQNHRQQRRNMSEQPVPVQGKSAGNRAERRGGVA